MVKRVCDNAAATGRSKAMHLLRCLSFFLAEYHIDLFAVDLPGRDNVVIISLCSVCRISEHLSIHHHSIKS